MHAHGLRFLALIVVVSVLCGKFINTESEGQVINRAGFLAEERSNQYSSSEIDDLKIRVFGDTAIASYALRQKYTSKGKAFDTHTHTRDRHVGEGAERRLAMRCRTRVYYHKDIGPSGSGKKPPASAAQALVLRDR
jgi:hypothetical protein